MQEKLRYVTKRRNRNGSLRFYWQRDGHDLERLPDDPVERFARASELNALADLKEPQEPTSAPMLEESVGWYIAMYRGRDEFKRLAAATKRSYEITLKDMERLWCNVPIGDLTRPVCVDYLDEIESLGMRRIARAAMLNVLNCAHNRGGIPSNPLLNHRMKVPRARKRLPTREEIAAFRNACQEHRHGEAMALALCLLIYTGQRPRDVLGMGWTHYQGNRISVTQDKTDVRLLITCHYELKDALQAARKRTRGTSMVTRPNGQPLSYDSFNRAWRDICALAGIEGLQARDFRRLAVVMLAEAGCDGPLIASITGHGLARCQQILETYFVRTEAMSREAIRRLEAWTRSRESNAPV